MVLSYQHVIHILTNKIQTNVRKVLLIGHAICYSNSKGFRTCVFAGGITYEHQGAKTTNHRDDQPD